MQKLHVALQQEENAMESQQLGLAQHEQLE